MLLSVCRAGVFVLACGCAGVFAAFRRLVHCVVLGWMQG
jgi:hypothetical protein